MDIMYAVKFTIVLAFLSLIEKDVKLGVLLAAGSNAGFYTRLYVFHWKFHFCVNKYSNKKKSSIAYTVPFYLL